MRAQRDQTTEGKILTRLRLWFKYRILVPLTGPPSDGDYSHLRLRSGSDAVVVGIEDHLSAIAACLKRGDIESITRRLCELTLQLLAEPLWGRALFIPELDEVAREVSLIVTPSPNRATDSKLLVHVASVVHPIGGHTRVIEDIAAALPEYRHVLIITDMATLAPMDLAPLLPRFKELHIKVRLLKASSWAEKVRELSSLVATLGPQAVLLLAHYADSIAFVGVAGHAAPRVLFLHHCDHMPALGASRTDYTHIDLTPGCHRFCAARPNLQAALVNLTVKDCGTVRMIARHPIIGVTCGREGKYQGASEFSYGQLLAALFSAGVGKIFHIGEMPKWQRDEICAEVAANGQDASRVTFLPNVPSLPAKLIEISPDFYLVSHPLVGGKATVEAMSVGLPILLTRPISASPLLNVDMTLGTSVQVADLAQISAAVRRLETEKDVLALNSRAVYEKYYLPQAFREGLLSAIRTDR
ncbi:MAG: hypothetical protein WBW31_15370 [Candidatus Sulfotelmatobacter sp.]